MEHPRRKGSPLTSDEGDAASHARLRVSPPATRNTQQSLRYRLMRDVLVRYVSPILVDSVLSRALAARRLTPSELDEGQLADVASDIMVGLRLFVPEQQLPSVMLALAEILESQG